MCKRFHILLHIQSNAFIVKFINNKFPNMLYLLHSIFLYNYFGLIFDQYIPSRLALSRQGAREYKGNYRVASLLAMKKRDFLQ